ncbi:HAMP domain-containing sensor histidine kinase [Rhizohabitans arisaemae]|uniref:HAMP domain-containing sensor histidine kinase n=1 Tax=Rhizohabitans arisaemae TaxID=2720610 RepID=UPI0024B1B445|nr:HAMP domain-containing sensor histidine kinase [Rhizohabitans arisaemae]
MFSAFHLPESPAVLAPLRRLSARTPLRIKLIAGLLALVVAALTVISVVSVSMLRGYLLERADEQLPIRLQSFKKGKPLLAGFIAQGRDRIGNTVWEQHPHGEEAVAGPDLSYAELRRGAGPATVPAVLGHGRWRVLIEPEFDGGFTVVGMNLADVDQTLSRLTNIELLVGGLVVVVLAGVGIVVVRASLSPLTEIEETAEAIAGGQLGRRVPDRDPRTEVGRLARSLNGMLAQIESAFAARAESEAAARRSEERMRRFVADASHELRTPLTTIRGFAEFYRQRPERDPERLDRLMRRLEGEAARMSVLVDDLLVLARSDQQRPLDRRPLDLLVLAADAVHDARVLAPERSIGLTVDGGAAFIVGGDEVRLRQVVGNLMSNALVHTPQGSPVQVRVSPGLLEDRQAAVLEVADEGPGLPPEQAERIFERFYRVDQARTRRTSGGSGLGLSIVAALVQAHGGTVAVRTEPGAGATFRVVLPLVAET